MNTSRSGPICMVSKVVNELVYAEQCSLEDNANDSWQELEKFWGEEKGRVQELDGQTKPKSNSLEEHLLNDDYIIVPSAKKDSKVIFGSVLGVNKSTGKEINDIPTSYVVSGFEPHELIAIGTYVDKSITPGFQYKVRKNMTDDYLFDGKSLHLETISAGYGKRITFKGDSLNENKNYFWSDSSVHGFGFTLQVLETNMSLTIMDTTTGQKLGRVIVINPSLSPDISLSSEIQDGGRIEKNIRVSFSCDVIMSDVMSRQNIFVENEIVQGVASVVRRNTSGFAKLEKITLENFILDGCHLLPEE